MKKRKTVFLSHFLIASIFITIISGCLGYVLGSVVTSNMNADAEESHGVQSDSHYSCSTCGYSFNDLSSLRMEYNNTNHFYYCPTCGELLTSDHRGNAITNMSTVDLYRSKVTDNWASDVESPSVSQYGNATSIVLLYDYDTETEQEGGQSYSIYLAGDRCTFWYRDSPSDAGGYKCELIKQTFYDFLDLVTSEELEEYERYTIDSDGKYVYDTKPYVLGIYYSGIEKPVFYKDPSNMADIIKEFERLKDIAME